MCVRMCVDEQRYRRRDRERAGPHMSVYWSSK